ncbi:MAG TPA: hypothetical protein VNO70_16855 [Blastocatellia bacterium]|nr:hypothetical protein [Blastocatellia bacterium]
MFESASLSSSSRNQKIIYGITTVFAIGLFLLVLWPLYSLLSSYERPSPMTFDSTAWQQKYRQESDGPMRIRMVDDLLNRHDFRGMSRSEVVSLLGEPDKAEIFPEWDMVYWLGPERHVISIDSEGLAFRLDEQKRISEYRLVTD